MTFTLQKRINFNINKIKFDGQEQSSSATTAFQYFKEQIKKSVEIKNMTKDMSKSKKCKFINNTVTYIWRNKSCASSDPTIKKRFTPLDKKDVEQFRNNFKHFKNQTPLFIKKDIQPEKVKEDTNKHADEIKKLRKIIMNLKPKVEQNELQINMLNSLIIPQIWKLLRNIASFIKFPSIA